MSETYSSENPAMEPVEMKKRDLVDDINVLNSLSYTLPSSLAAAVSRVNKVSYADKTNYNQNDGEIVIRLVSSSDFIKMQTSYLTFDLTVSSGTLGVDANLVATATPLLLTFGCGGALSMFQRLVLESKSGMNLLYKDQANLIMTQLLYANNPAGYILDMANCGQMLVDTYGRPFSWFNSQTGALPNRTDYPSIFSVYGALNLPYNTNIGAPPINGSSTVVGSNITQVNLGSYATGGEFTPRTVKVLIPLCWLDPFFDTACMIPSSLASGLRIRLALRNVLNMFMVVNNTATNQPSSCLITAAGTIIPPLTVGYSINNPQVVLDTYNLSPQIYSRLSQVSASQGLDVTFKTHWFQSTNITGSATTNVEINKSVARALAVYMCAIPQPAPFFWDPNLTISSNLIQYSSRLGSLVFPAPSALTIFTVSAPTSGQVQQYSQEFYHLFLVAMKKAGITGSKYGPCDISYNDFVYGFNMLSQTLERSSLDMSGIPLNNSRSYSAQLKFAVNLTTQINSYLEHVAVAKVFLKETVLKL